MTTEQYIDVVLDVMHDLLGDPSTLEPEPDDISFVWDKYNKTWCLVRRICDDNVKTIQKYSKKVDDFFVPYFARIQPMPNYIKEYLNDN